MVRVHDCNENRQWVVYNIVHIYYNEQYIPYYIKYTRT